MTVKKKQAGTPEWPERSEGQSLGRRVDSMSRGYAIHTLCSQLTWAAGPDELELESVSSQMMEVVRTERLILLPVIKLVVQQGRCRELSLRNYGFERLLWSDLGA